MCGSMVDIQSVAAEIRRGKKRKKKQDENIYGLPYYIGRPYLVNISVACVCVQLMCCAVESNGWHLFRQSEWFKQFGARDDDAVTYEGNACQFHCLVVHVVRLVTKTLETHVCHVWKSTECILMHCMCLVFHVCMFCLFFEGLYE